MFTFVKMALSVSKNEDLPLHQINVKEAFLNGGLDKAAYVEQPTGFIDTTKKHLVCCLKITIYGLRHAP